MTEEELVEQLKVISLDLQNARLKVTQINKDLVNAETEVIDAKLKKEKLEETLDRLRNRKINTELSDREKDLERFRKLLPEYLERIKDEKIRTK